MLNHGKLFEFLNKQKSFNTQSDIFLVRAEDHGIVGIGLNFTSALKIIAHSNLLSDIQIQEIIEKGQHKDRAEFLDVLAEYGFSIDEMTAYGSLPEHRIRQS